MWRKLNNSHFLQYSNELEQKTVFVTDFVKIWSNRYSVVAFLDFLKDSNFILVNIKDTELLEKGMRILKNPEESRISTVNVDGAILKIFMSAEYGYPFSLDLHLNEGSKELFFQMVTQPLLKCVRDLHSSENDLIIELQKKDKEIEEYKAEGGRIALKHLKTRPFNKEVHVTNHRVYEENFCISTFPQEILDKQINNVISVKREVSDSANSKTENADTKYPVAVKKELEVDINQTIKAESDTQSQPTISPKKTQKRKLNL